MAELGILIKGGKFEKNSEWGASLKKSYKFKLKLYKFIKI